MTSKDFCEAYSSFYGDKIYNLEQLTHVVFDGHELFEFANYLIHRNDKKDEEVLLVKERGICIIGALGCVQMDSLKGILKAGLLLSRKESGSVATEYVPCPEDVEVEVQPTDLRSILKESCELIEMQHYEDVDVTNQMLDPKPKPPRQPRVKQRAKQFAPKRAWRVHQRRG